MSEGAQGWVAWGHVALLCLAPASGHMEKSINYGCGDGGEGFFQCSCPELSSSQAMSTSIMTRAGQSHWQTVGNTQMESANELDFSLILLKTTRSVLVRCFFCLDSELTCSAAPQLSKWLSQCSFLVEKARHLVRWEPCLLLLSAFGDPEEAL